MSSRVDDRGGSGQPTRVGFSTRAIAAWVLLGASAVPVFGILFWFSAPVLMRVGPGPFEPPAPDRSLAYP